MNPITRRYLLAIGRRPARNTHIRYSPPVVDNLGNALHDNYHPQLDHQHLGIESQSTTTVSDFDYSTMLSERTQKRKKALERLRSRKTSTEYACWLNASAVKNHETRKANSETGWGLQNKGAAS